MQRTAAEDYRCHTKMVTKGIFSLQYTYVTDTGGPRGSLVVMSPIALSTFSYMNDWLSYGAPPEDELLATPNGSLTAAAERRAAWRRLRTHLQWKRIIVCFWWFQFILPVCWDPSMWLEPDKVVSLHARKYRDRSIRHLTINTTRPTQLDQTSASLNAV